MLRTRRRDNNVKPNRRDSSFKSRLDRKSSRGMLYENEELRLKTININAEIERGQSDIKKLKRENEMLKKEIWCLRDEYDKLDRLLKDKKIDFSSSSTTYTSSSESESCSSCSEESEEVETTQNLKNVQKTNLRNIQDQFDHLSIVTEENSCENSDKNSFMTRHSLPNDQIDNMLWNYNDKDVIQPDQSYPVMYGRVVQNNRSQTLPNQMHANYFSPIQHSKSFDDNHFNQVHPNPLYPGDFYTPPQSCHNNMESHTPPIAISPSPPSLFENQQVVFPDRNSQTANFLSKKIVHTDANNFYQNMVLVGRNQNAPVEARAMEKKSTDLIVKIDNQNFNKNLTYSNTTPSTTFSNGGNLEELLHDIESISQKGLHPDQQQQLPTIQEPTHHHSNFSPEIQDRDLTYSQNPVMGHLMNEDEADRRRQMSASEERLHKSELNVVLMPKAMPLIGFDKYKNIQRSMESINSAQLQAMSASQQDLCIINPKPEEHDEKLRPNVHLNLNVPTSSVHADSTPPYTGKTDNPEQNNPFFFGNINDNYVNSDYFTRRYNPDNFTVRQDETSSQQGAAEQRDGGAKFVQSASISEAQQVENEENIKLKTTKTENKPEKPDSPIKKPPEQVKSPKLSITRKVSIHFKGKKEKERLKRLASESNNPEIKSGSKGVQGGKKSLLDFRISSDTSKEKSEVALPSPKPKEKYSKLFHQKTPSIESKKSTTETSNFEPKTPNSTDSDKKKDRESRKEERKPRKSASVSPERSKHVHLVPEVPGMKKHKKHRRERSGTSRIHRASIDPRLRERSFSVCTEKSTMGAGLGLGVGMGYGSFLYDDYSDRERTNSGSSCESHEIHRKLSGISNVPVNGKLPWCGCWGNGCL